MPLINQYNLPIPSVPLKPRKLSDQTRRNQIVDEIIESQAHYLILLGDEPIQWFLKFFDNRWKRLADFGTTEESYGNLHDTRIDSVDLQILPLTHPRQVSKLGRHSEKWYQAHQVWLKKKASLIAEKIN
jgi:uracil-DNA glycosylase